MARKLNNQTLYFDDRQKTANIPCQPDAWDIFFAPPLAPTKDFDGHHKNRKKRKKTESMLDRGVNMHTRFTRFTHSTHFTHVGVHTWLWIMAHTTPSSCSLHLGTATLLRHTSRADTAAWREIVDSRNWNATYKKQRKDKDDANMQHKVVTPCFRGASPT